MAKTLREWSEEKGIEKPIKVLEKKSRQPSSTVETQIAPTPRPKNPWCRLFGHDWTTYGWTGNCNWPSHGKECRRCAMRIPWPDAPSVPSASEEHLAAPVIP